MVDYEYFDTGSTGEPITDKQKELDQIARSYSTERDLAFFVVNFGLSKSEYNEFTELEKAFIRKEYESKTVTDMTHLRNAVLNAISNALRKKGKRFIDLFKKKQEKVDVEFNENAVEIIQEIEEKEGKGWVDLLYEKANLRRPKQEEGE